MTPPLPVARDTAEIGLGIAISRHDSQAGAADGAIVFIERTVTALARGGLLGRQ